MRKVDPKFLSTQSVLRIHSRVVGQGTCNKEQLDSAVHAVESYAIYGEPEDLFDLAAAYAFYISEAQSFTIGNKRTAIGACRSFLSLNGVPVRVYSEPDLFDWITGMANKHYSRDDFAQKLRQGMPLDATQK